MTFLEVYDEPAGLPEPLPVANRPKAPEAVAHPAPHGGVEDLEAPRHGSGPSD